MDYESRPKRLYRSRDRILGGVLSGFAEYINADITLIRVVFVLLSILSAAFPGLLVILSSGLLRRKSLWISNKAYLDFLWI